VDVKWHEEGRRDGSETHRIRTGTPDLDLDRFLSILWPKISIWKIKKSWRVDQKEPIQKAPSSIVRGRTFILEALDLQGFVVVGAVVVLVVPCVDGKEGVSGGDELWDGE